MLERQRRPGEGGRGPAPRSRGLLVPVLDLGQLRQPSSRDWHLALVEAGRCQVKLTRRAPGPGPLPLAPGGCCKGLGTAPTEKGGVPGARAALSTVLATSGK